MTKSFSGPLAWKWFWPTLAGLVFFLSGLALIPYPGLHHDELFFAGPIYDPNAAFYSLNIGSAKIPLMVMSYSGAFKTWVFAALFQFFEPNVWSVRVPVLALGAVTLFLTWAWVARIAGRRAADVAVVLLATDTIFLMTATFDWGPVAFQHVFLMSGLLALRRWFDAGRTPWLALAFFLWGLGMWDKALLAWPLIGLGAAAICVFTKQVVARIRPQAVAVAVAAFLLGAAPLVWFNVARPGETAKANARFTASGFGDKATVLRQTLDGSTLFGYMAQAGASGPKRQPRNAVERFSTALQHAVGPRYRNWMRPALLLGLACVFVFRATPIGRILVFLLLTMAVAWLQMAFTRGTGGASHHTILLWPFPAVFLGVAFSSMADRIPQRGAAAVAALTAILAAGNLLNTNEYLADFAVNGPAGVWTDAIFPLSDGLSPRSASWIGIVDWGCLNGLRLLHEGELRMFMADPEGPLFARQVASKDFLYIQHTKARQVFPGVNDRIRSAAAGLGYSERVERVVSDGNGRPVFEVFRFEKVEAR